MSTIQRRYQRKRKPPRGWSYIEPVMTALESEMKDAIADPHEGKRRAQLLWPVYQINNQRSRYIYDMFYRYKLISRELYDYCLREKLADASLIAKWKKPGYDRLCCTHSINPRNFNFGSVSICRVPKFELEAGRVVVDQTCGCRGCASGPGGYKNIYGNKFGQNLADIQVRREKKKAKEEGREWPMVAEEPRRRGDMPVYESVYEDTFSYPTVWESDEEENENADEEDADETGGQVEEKDGQQDDTGEQQDDEDQSNAEQQTTVEGAAETSKKRAPETTDGPAEDEADTSEKRRRVEQESEG